MSVHPHLFFTSTCREAMTRYQEILGGRLTALADHDGTHWLFDALADDHSVG